MSGIQRNTISNMAHLDETPLVVRLLRTDIRPDPENRKERDQETLKGIAASMRPPGRQLQPILVWEPPTEPGLQIILGEGRWLAAGINEDLSGEPQYLDCVIVENVDYSDVKAMQIVENLQREDPTEMQYAEAFHSLLALGKCKTNKAVAERTGVSEATVSVYLSVLKGPTEITQLVKDGIAKMDTARTVVEIAKTHPDEAAKLVKKGNDEGKLKREDVRPVLTEVKGKTPPAKATPAPAAEAPVPQPAPAPLPAKAAPQAPAADFPGQAAPVDKALIPVPATRIHVNVFGTSDATTTFHENVKLHGVATLADDVVHSDTGRAWIRFGDDANNHMMSVLCIDLEIVKIVRRD